MIIITPATQRILQMTGDGIWHDVDIWVDNETWQDRFDPFSISPSIIGQSGVYDRPFPSGSGMYKLLPTGEAWPLEHETTILRDFIYGLGMSLDTLNTAAKDNLDILLPGDTGQYLQDWEHFLGLPKCEDISLTLQQRASSVLAMWNITPYSNAAFFEDIGAVFGFDIKVTNGVRGTDRDVFTIIVTVDNPDQTIEFSAGASSAGDRLIEYDFGPVECLINFFKPAHTYIIFVFDLDGTSSTIGLELLSGTYTAN